MLEKILEPLLFRKLEKMAHFYQREEYEKILKIYNKPIVCSQSSDVFRNAIRICSLICTANDVWGQEYKASMKSGEFDKFLTANDKGYIQFYIYSQLDEDELDSIKYVKFKLPNVSDRMKKIFPLNASQLSIH